VLPLASCCQAWYNIVNYYIMEEVQLEQTIKPRRSVGKIVIGIVIAVILGVLHPFTLVFQVMMPLSVSIMTMAAAVLYVYGGLIPAATLCTVGTLLAFLGYGPQTGAATLPLIVLPAAVIIFGIRAKKPFFEQMKLGQAAGILGAVAAMALITLFFGDEFVSLVVAQVKDTFEMMKDLMLEAVNIYLPAESAISMEEFSGIYYDMFRLMQEYYESNLLANLISGAVYTVAISVLWGNWLAARRGEATTESFRGLCDWFLPSNLTWGLLLMLICSALLLQFPVRGNAEVWAIVSSLCGTVFSIQGFAALDRRMKAGGSSGKRRTTMIVLLVLFGSYATQMITGMTIFSIMALVGGASAAFGRNGAARPWINKIKENMNGDDE